MEELIVLVELVKSLPTMAIWLIVLYFFYQAVIVGSIYGIIKLGITKLHSWAVAISIDCTVLVSNVTITGVELEFREALRKLKGVRTGKAGGSYIHSADVEWLNSAIDEKKEREK